MARLLPAWDESMRGRFATPRRSSRSPERCADAVRLPRRFDEAPGGACPVAHARSTARDRLPPRPAPRSADDDARATRSSGACSRPLLGAFDLLVIQLGMELGLYAALRDQGPATAAELAARAGIDARYAREWLEHQAVDRASSTSPSRRRRPRCARYALPAGHAAVVLDPDSLSTMAPMPAFVVSAARGLPGARRRVSAPAGGVDWNEYPRVSEAQEAANRPAVPPPAHPGVAAAIPDVARAAAGGRRAGRGRRHGQRLVGDRDRPRLPGSEVHGLDLDARRRSPGRRRLGARRRGSPTGSGSTSSTPATQRSRAASTS